MFQHRPHRRISLADFVSTEGVEALKPLETNPQPGEHPVRELFNKLLVASALLVCAHHFYAALDRGRRIRAKIYGSAAHLANAEAVN